MHLAEKKAKVSILEYVSYLQTIDGRAEYYDGVIYDISPCEDAVAGGSANHGKIGMNVGTALNNALASKDCSVFGADTSLEIEEQNTAVMPEVQVTCGDPQLSKHGNGMHVNASLVVEVLSPSTASNDRGAKFHRYMLVPDLMGICW